MRIFFTVLCDKCNQRLESVDGLLHTHLNNDDCDGGDATLPEVTPEQLADLFTPETLAGKQRKVQKKEIEKSTKKK